jgi:hypothetical protein
LPHPATKRLILFPRQFPLAVAGTRRYPRNKEVNKMRTALMLVLAVFFFASTTAAQIGPKVYDKPKPDSTKTKPKIAKPDTTAKPVKPAKKAKPKKATKTTKPAKPAKAEPAKKEPVKKEPAAKKAKPKPESKPELKPKPKEAKPKSQETKTGTTKKKTMAQSGNLKRFLFTTAIENREPVGKIDSLSTATDLVYCFTEIVGLKGHTLTHRWTYKNEVQAQVPVNVGSPRWRAFSSKKFLRGWTGEWTVEIVDAEGNILGKKRLVYFDAVRVKKE